MDARQAQYLREKHGAKLASADHAKANGALVLRPLLQLSKQAHF